MGFILLANPRVVLRGSSSVGKRSPLPEGMVEFGDKHVGAGRGGLVGSKSTRCSPRIVICGSEDGPYRKGWLLSRYAVADVLPLPTLKRKLEAEFVRLAGPIMAGRTTTSMAGRTSSLVGRTSSHYGSVVEEDHGARDSGAVVDSDSSQGRGTGSTIRGTIQENVYEQTDLLLLTASRIYAQSFVELDVCRCRLCCDAQVDLLLNILI